MDWTAHDRVKFDQWAKEVHGQLLGSIRRCGVPRDQAEDIMQEVFLGVLVHWKELDSYEKFKAFCMKRAQWRVLDAWRSHGKSAAQDYAMSTTNEGAGSPHQAGIQDAEAFVHGRELMKAIHELPERTRQVMLLSISGLTSAEIARELNTEPSSVRSLLRYARFQLASRVENGEPS